MKIEYLEHPADFKVRCTADSLENAFSLVAKSFGDYLKCSKKSGTYSLEIHSHRLTSLLYDYIAELLYKLDTNQYVPLSAKCTIAKAKGGFVLQADISYEKKSLSHPFKSPTYHEMIITTEKKYKLEFVVDI